MKHVRSSKRPLVNGARGERVFSLKEFNEFLKSGKSPLKEISKEELEELTEVGLNKGLPFELSKGEIIYVPEDAWIKTKVFKNNGNVYPMIYIVVETSLRQEEIDFPIAIFRRLPHLQEDRDTLQENNPFWDIMLQNDLGDLNRALKVEGKNFEVIEKLSLKKLTFVRDANGKASRVSDDDVKKDPKASKGWFYKFKFVED